MKENKEDEIQSKIALIEKQINDDLTLIPEYKLLTVYNKLSKIINKDDRKYLILRNKFIFIDKTLTGYINLKDFYDVLNNNLPLEPDELKLLLCDPALRNKINPNLYQYKPFFDLVRHFKENDLLKMKQEYNQEQNPYIIKLKNEIKEKKVDLNNLWKNVFKNGIKCTKENFNLFFIELKPTYNFHKIEIEYIFDIICEIGENNIKYENFRNIMNKKTTEDIRVIYFKGLKEFRRKEKEKEKEEQDNLLINYYPNVLENNNAQVENLNENTKYLIIKGEEILNNTKNKNEISNNINNNENKNDTFILGNIQVEKNDNLENLNDLKNKQPKEIKSISGILNISESLVIKAKPKTIEKESLNKNENEKNESSKIIYKKYYPRVFDIQNKNSEQKIYTINDEKLKETTKIEQKNIFDEKLKLTSNKVYQLLNMHEENRVLILYLSLKNQFNLKNENILSEFMKKDINNTKYLSSDDFISILKNDLNMNFNNNDFILLLNGLQSQNNEKKLYPYEEFINNVKSISIEKSSKQIEAIKNLALLNFNDYFVELKRFITKNNIDLNAIFNAFSNDKLNLNLNNFIFLLKSLDLNLDNLFEYNYLFNILSKHPEKKLLSKKDFLFFIGSEIISEETFLKEGKVDKNFHKNLKKFWYKLIPKYSRKIFNLINLNNFEHIFFLIKKQETKFGINNLADLFSSIYEINLDGNIKKAEFLNILKTLEINDSKIINDLLISFQDSYDKNLFKLFNFLGVFNSFEEQNKYNIDSPPTNFKISPKNPNIIFKNNYGFFTGIDFAKIKAFCLLIYEKIVYIKRQNINEYFTKFDLFKKGYYTLLQFKTILIDDLDLKKYELIEIFLSYILDDEKQDDSYIIQLTKLVELINKFNENKVEDEKLNLQNTFNYTNEIFNKLMNSTIMDVRIHKKEESNYYYSPNAGID